MPGHIFASTCGRLDCSSFCFSLLFSHLYRHSRLICLKWLPLSHILHWQISSHWVANTRWILAVTLSRLSSYLSLCICKNCFSYGMFGFSSLLLAFRNDERVFFAFRLVGRSMHCPSSFFFLPHTSLLFSFPFPLSFPFFYLPPTLVIYISWLQSWQEQFDFIWRALVNRVYISFLSGFGS